MKEPAYFRAVERYAGLDCLLQRDQFQTGFEQVARQADGTLVLYFGVGM